MGDTLANLSLHWKQRVVRMCPNKPAKMGIWSHQAVVFLANELPFLVYTKAHVAPSALDMTLQTHTVVRDWANICRRFKSSAVLVMDSYYLSAPGRSILNDSEEKVYFIAALKRDRFKKINGFLEPKIEKSGDTAVAFNTSRGEAAVYHWSLDTNVGKKLVMSNAFTVKMGESHRKGCLPVYDHYNGIRWLRSVQSGLAWQNVAPDHQEVPCRIRRESGLQLSVHMHSAKYVSRLLVSK